MLLDASGYWPVTQHSVTPTDYPEVNSVLRELLSGVQRTLGDHFVGMSEDTFEVLKTMHDRIAGGASKWGRELEGSYISQRALRYERWPAAHPYIDRGSVLAMVRPFAASFANGGRPC
jgi:hypothetical protein